MCEIQMESCQTVFCKQMSTWENKQQKLLENIKADYFQ